MDFVFGGSSDGRRCSFAGESSRPSGTQWPGALRMSGAHLLPHRGLPRYTASHQRGNRHGAGQAVLVKTVTEMRATEPGVANALESLDFQLRVEHSLVEYWVLEFELVEYQIFRNFPLRIETDK